MKQGSFKAVCLILMAIMAVSFGFADEATVDLESTVLETFDGDSPYEWRAVGSKFATKADGESYPKVSLVSTWPQALHGLNRDGKDLKSLGIWSRFDRRGYNWIDIYPVEKGAGDDAVLKPIPIPGRARYFDLWVWGSNLNYEVEIYIRDYQGVVHVLKLGHIAYQGWRNLRVAVPSGIPQGKRVLPRLASLEFVKFRIWTMPTEQVSNAYVYFDQFKVLSDMFESLFDGDELADPQTVQELWSGGTPGGSRGSTQSGASQAGGTQN
jgi:hypothetical protein